MSATVERGISIPGVTLLLALTAPPALAHDASVEDALAAAGREAAAARHDRALERLRALFESGLETPSRVLADPRFNPLREEPEARAAWRELMGRHVRESRITMVTPEEPGTPMTIRGQVLRAPDGAAVAGAVVELYHTDASGNYEPGGTVGQGTNARLFGFVRTDDQGRFEVHTIQPAPYPGSGPGAAHVHYRIEREGFRTTIDEFRPYDHPRDFEERMAAPSRGRPASSVRESDGTLVCEATLPLVSAGGP